MLEGEQQTRKQKDDEGCAKQFQHHCIAMNRKCKQPRSVSDREEQQELFIPARENPYFAEQAGAGIYRKQHERNREARIPKRPLGGAVVADQPVKWIGGGVPQIVRHEAHIGHRFERSFGRAKDGVVERKYRVAELLP